MSAEVIRFADAVRRRYFRDKYPREIRQRATRLRRVAEAIERRAATCDPQRHAGTLDILSLLIADLESRVADWAWGHW